MPSLKIQLVNGEIYHVVLRGVGDSVIFNNENDYYRGIFSIYEFNNNNSVNVWKRRRLRKKEKIGLGLTPPERDFFVEVLAFCFMPNHVHLLLRQLKGDGISQFMQKFGTGYVTYFNKKYNRKGHLLTKFKAVHIKSNDQLKNVFTYIHTNPVSLVEPGWKEKGVNDSKKVIKFLKNYKWSSYRDYIGKKNFPSVTERNFLLKVIDGAEGCLCVVNDWIKFKKEIKDFSPVVLE